jgi:hypothetical protein
MRRQFLLLGCKRYRRRRRSCLGDYGTIEHSLRWTAHAIRGVDMSSQNRTLRWSDRHSGAYLRGRKLVPVDGHRYP